MNKTAATGGDKNELCCVAKKMAFAVVTCMKLLKNSAVAFTTVTCALMIAGFMNLSAVVPFVIQDNGHT